MRIIFSVFKEDLAENKKEKVFEECVETNLNIEAINPLADIDIGYSYELFVGKTLVFWDISCFNNTEQSVINYIKHIPREINTDFPEENNPAVFVAKYYNPNNSDDIVEVNFDGCYYCTMSKYECGASGFDQTVLLINNCPILNNIIAGIIVQTVSWFFSKVFKLLRKKTNGNISKSREIIVLDTKKLKKNFSKASSIEKTNFQIMSIERIKNRKYSVQIRTINNSIYSVVAYWNGKIEALRLLEK